MTFIPELKIAIKHDFQNKIFAQKLFPDVELACQKFLKRFFDDHILETIFENNFHSKS